MYTHNHNHSCAYIYIYNIHPVSITRFPLRIISPGAGLLRNPFCSWVVAKIFQGLGSKRRESSNGDRVYDLLLLLLLLLIVSVLLALLVALLFVSVSPLSAPLAHTSIQNKHIYICVYTHIYTYNRHLGLINAPPLICVFPPNDLFHY